VWATTKDVVATEPPQCELVRSYVLPDECADFPDLELRATAGPAILFYTAAVCGKPIEAEAIAARLTALLFTPLPIDLTRHLDDRYTPAPIDG
jgi:hypothetical protein